MSEVSTYLLYSKWRAWTCSLPGVTDCDSVGYTTAWDACIPSQSAAPHLASCSCVLGPLLPRAENWRQCRDIPGCCKDLESEPGDGRSFLCLDNRGGKPTDTGWAGEESEVTELPAHRQAAQLPLVSLCQKPDLPPPLLPFPACLFNPK